ncbi:putative RNA-editing complex protein MP100 [Leishmania mexicana MHOM/GT/2001/U1103]|uniref:RNA-editing complex protein MP100 n=1 Tax=Leishmania mexicana (strain MHOM/GT/2001/U1103) TaxID=929439 RepID=E9AY64_LEIMU|nr:putative RNA-editing complex protein MP100 [Leishmania mexicana MHOM/GT/2001/U1103]CBZ27905.1 putative RNA-editing complex protein MP100 [Leishmania mexicana MHOM/GT/2001/U1103]
MRGVLARTACRLTSLQKGTRLADVYQLLITKKPVEYDYVAVDVNAFVGSAMRITKNMSPEQRRNKEASRHVLNAIMQMLRRVVCRHSLLLAFDGPDTLAKAYKLRTTLPTRRLDMQIQRLPGGVLMRAVEDRIVKTMPLGRGLIPGEVVVSGVNVEGPVERKVTAWALDLACRDGAQHTSKSLCIIGAGELWMSVLALTPYFQGTNIVHGSSDLRHMSLNDCLTWLQLGDDLLTGDARVITAVRTDALLLYLLCHGCSTTDLSPLSGSNFTVLMEAYHTRRREAAATAGAAAGAPIFQLLREQLNGGLVLDVQALYLLFVAEKDVAETVQSLAALVVPAKDESPHTAPLRTFSMPLSTSGGSASEEQMRDANALDMLHSSYLSHLLNSHHLFSHGEMLGRSRVPAYMEAEVRMGSLGRSGAAGVRASVVAVGDWTRFLLRCLQRGGRYAFASDAGGELSYNTSKCAPSATTAADVSAASSSTAPGTAAYYPFWSSAQPLTAAEYTILSTSNSGILDPLLADYMPGVMPALRSELPRALTSVQANLHELRSSLQHFFARAAADRPHPSLCLAPSYHWCHNEKNKVWSMRYVDLGVVARQQGVRHARSLLPGMGMEQETPKEGAVVYDAESQTWTSQPRNFAVFTASEHVHVHRPSSSFMAATTVTSADAAEVPTLRVLTWNVMFDRYSNQPTPLGMPGIDWCSPKRYPVLAKLIDAEDADVVGMQEVERPFAEYLAAQPWCRERYIMSCSPQSPILDPWGVLLLVRRGGRWPLQQLKHLNVPAWPGHVSLMPVATLDLSAAAAHSDDSGTGGGGSAGKSGSRKLAALPRVVNVCSMHLLAPFVKVNEVARTGQDQALRHALTRQLHGDTLVMGDFNDWPSNEFLMPPESRYVECWPIIHPGDYGKTMDESNTFCKLKIEEIFFGRSDKVFLRTGTATAAGLTRGVLRPVEAHLVGTRSVNAENGNQEAPAYLFPSDHYGVSMQFEVL